MKEMNELTAIFVASLQDDGEGAGMTSRFRGLVFGNLRFNVGLRVALAWALLLGVPPYGSVVARSWARRRLPTHSVLVFLTICSWTSTRPMRRFFSRCGPRR